LSFVVVASSIYRGVTHDTSYSTTLVVVPIIPRVGVTSRATCVSRPVCLILIVSAILDSQSYVDWSWFDTSPDLCAPAGVPVPELVT
jgi:hypothetical protein